VIYWKKKTDGPHIQKGVINNLSLFSALGMGKKQNLSLGKAHGMSLKALGQQIR
jgi:hypothetical protein